MRARRTRRLGGIVAVGLGGLLVTACGGGSTAAPRGATVVETAQVGGLGPVLTTKSGRVLYMFPPDDDNRVTCVGHCATMWPPLLATGGQKPFAGPGVKQPLLRTDRNPAGGARVVTYAGWPLYTYVDDTTPRKARGQGLLADGGYWYVITPTGQPLTVGEP